jgi:hypothetical protein
LTSAPQTASSSSSEPTVAPVTSLMSIVAIVFLRS